MISSKGSTDKRLNDVSVEAHLLFYMILPHLDRDGMMHGHPRVLGGLVCPLRPELFDRIEELLAELCEAGLIDMFEADDGPVVWFPRFGKYQKGMRYDRERESEFPCPPGWRRSGWGLEPIPIAPDQELSAGRPRSEPATAVEESGGARPETHPATAECILNESAPTPDALRTNSGSCPPEREVEEEKEGEAARVRAREGERQAAAAAAPPSSFEAKSPTFGARSSTFEAAYREVCEAYHNNIGSLTAVVADEIADLLKGENEEPLTPAQWICEAIEIAARRNKRRWDYARGCIDRWHSEGRTEENTPSLQREKQTGSNGAVRPGAGGAPEVVPYDLSELLR